MEYGRVYLGGCHMKYSIEKGCVLSQGIPNGKIYLADNRLSCEITTEGIGDVEFYNATTKGHQLFFRSGFWGGLRFYINHNGTLYPLQIKECRVLPFGYQGEWNTPVGTYRFSIFLAEDSIVCHFAPRDNAQPVKLQLEFYEEYCFSPIPGADPRYRSPISRTWEPLQQSASAYFLGFNEKKASSYVAIGSNKPLHFTERTQNKKFILTMEETFPEEENSVIFAFDISEKNAALRLQQGIVEAKQWQIAQEKRYKSIAENAPRLSCGKPALEAFFQLAPLYHESLKIVDTPGAIRAKTTNFWVWGWDSLTAPQAMAYWGDTQFVEQMLLFFKNHSDNRGIPHAFARDMTSQDICPPPAQGMYITALYLAYQNGVSIDSLYPFAKEIIEKIYKAEVGESGLISGTSLYPDYRNLILETGDDISSFNNTVAYCAVRSFEQLAKAQGEAQDAIKAAEFAEKTKKNYASLFYSADVGFLTSSLEATTYEKRYVYGANAIKRENHFVNELVEDLEKKLLLFFEQHLVARNGLRPLATWSEGFDEDANQLSTWWPIMGEYYASLINRFNRQELLETYTQWLSYWTEKLMCPEGISCYSEQEVAETNHWNALQGTWQAYNIRGWYQGILHFWVGVEIIENALLLHPHSGPALSITGLHWGEIRMDIEVKGQGETIKEVILNGKSIGAVQQISKNKLGTTNQIIVYRQKAQGGKNGTD